MLKYITFCAIIMQIKAPITSAISYAIELAVTIVAIIRFELKGARKA